MNGDSYNITIAEGGFIVHVSRPSAQPADGVPLGGHYESRVFIDAPALLDYLSSELSGE